METINHKLLSPDIWAIAVYIAGHTDLIRSVYADKDFVYTSADDKTVKVWERDSWQEIATL